MSHALRMWHRTMVLIAVVTLSAVDVDVAAASPLPGLLSPQSSESREIISLNGVWSFYADTEDIGFTRDDFWKQGLKASGLGHAVVDMPVPSSFNDISTNIYLKEFVGMVWYEREFVTPWTWRLDSMQALLHFGSANYQATVFVNGVEVMKHHGGSLPFQADVAPLLVPSGFNRLTVALNNTLSPETLPPGRTLDNPAGRRVQRVAFDFFNYAGIHRSVSLIATPRSVHIDDISVTSTLGDRQAMVDVEVVTGGGGEGGIAELLKQGLLPQVSAVLTDADGKVVAEAAQMEIFGKLPGVFRTTLVVHNPNLWWAKYMSDRPGYLYVLTVTATLGTKTRSSQDVYRVNVGLREVKSTTTQLLLNGEPVYLHGINKHEDNNVRGRAVDNVMMVKDFELLDWAGVNSIRTSHYPYAEEWYDVADREGIMVIDECSGVGILEEHYIDGGPLQRHHLLEVEELVRRDKNRASVIMWSVANEPQAEKAGADIYFKPIFAKTRQLDSTRPVVFVTDCRTCSHPREDLIMQFSDVVLLNDYTAWYGNYPGELDIVNAQLTKELEQWHETFHIPVMVSEYGADTIAGFHSAPAVLFTEEFQTAFNGEFQKVFDDLRSRPNPWFIGEHPWNFADFMTVQGITRVVGNKKGLFTRDRQPKAAAHQLKARYEGMISSSRNCPLQLVQHQDGGCEGGEQKVLVDMRALADMLTPKQIMALQKMDLL